MKRKSILIILFIFGFIAMSYVDTLAQCPMCRMSAESNLRAGGTAGAGLNAGILYMLAMPYLLVLTFGLIFYRHRKRKEESDYELHSMN